MCVAPEVFVLACRDVTCIGLKMDIRDLKFDDNSFDVAVDKGMCIGWVNL